MTSNDASPSPNMHIPIAIACLALSLFLAAQIGAVRQGFDSMEWQKSNLDKQMAALGDTGTKLTDLIKQREAIVKQSEQVQAQYTALLTDVIELAKTDADAKKVVEKWKIQQQQPPATTAAPDASSKPASSIK